VRAPGLGRDLGTWVSAGTVRERGGGAVIRAAGGLLWRDGPRGAEIAVVHRPRYDDWSLPKGELEAGESWEEAAVREVAEETGCEVHISDFAGSLSYEVRGSPKEVRFWNMAVAGDCAFRPDDEVDELRWLSFAEALETLDYELERCLLRDNEHAAQP